MSSTDKPGTVLGPLSTFSIHHLNLTAKQVMSILEEETEVQRVKKKLAKELKVLRLPQIICDPDNLITATKGLFNLKLYH